MTDEDNNQSPPRPLTRLERALLEQNMFIPPKMKTEINDALKAIAVEQGFRNSTDLDEYEVRIESKQKDGKSLFVINIFGYYKKMGEAERIVEHVKAFIDRMKDIDPKYKTIHFEKASETRLVMECPYLRTLLDSVVVGYINKVSISPYSKVDIDAIMNEPKTWVLMEKKRRQGSGEDSGTPGGTPGGGGPG